MDNSQIKLICFDLNKTLIKENSWFRLNIDLGMTKEEDEILFKLWEEGTISYVEWQEIIGRIYVNRGMPSRETRLR